MYEYEKCATRIYIESRKLWLTRYMRPGTGIIYYIGWEDMQRYLDNLAWEAMQRGRNNL